MKPAKVNVNLSISLTCNAIHMDPCKLKEPRVIDNELLRRCITEHLPKGEPGRLAELEPIPISEVEQVRLEFQNLLKIDHLWVLKSVTKLSLNNNLIEVIENIDCLANLVELDLSFNHIEKIENLTGLTKLVKLSLYNNDIVKIENMDTLKKLTIFSIGKNKIEDAYDIIYLRRFPELKSLNMAGNPCAEVENFRLMIAAFLPQIVYYEYRRLYPWEKEAGCILHSTKLRQIEKEEEEINIVRKKKEKQLADAELHSVSFVEYLNTDHLFQSLFADDADGVALLEVGDEVKECYEEYETQFNETCSQIFAMGQKQYVIRKDEVDQFLKCVGDAQRANQENSIKHMEPFMHRKEVIFAEIKQLQEQLNWGAMSYQQYNDFCDEYLEEYEQMLHNNWKVLMKLEMELHEQMEEVNQTFEHTMTEMVNVFIEAAQTLFSQIRTMEVTYMENVSEAALRFHTNLNLSENIVVPEILKPIMVDKDGVLNALGASHDIHMQLIDNREDTLVSRAKQWISNMVDNLERDEIRRNRNKVLEIMHFGEVMREDFNSLNAEYGIDRETAALLED